MRRKQALIIITVILFIALFMALIFYFNNRVVDDNSGFTLKDNLTVKVYDELRVSDFIDTIEGKIITNDKVDTSSLGNKEITFIYFNKNDKKRRGKFKVKVVDTEKPLVWLSSSYNIRVNSDVDLEKTIMCADNYDANPSCKIVGEYDVNTTGSYKLSYVAKDSSNNEEVIDFTLNVYEPSNDSSGVDEVPVTTSFNEVLSNYKKSNNEIGIDVSKWQGKIDFKKVKNAGASFVMIRLGSQSGVGGNYVIDSYFEENIKGAKASGLKVGVYFYSYADSVKEARKQAKWVLGKIKKYQIDLPVAFDWECYNSFNGMELSLFGLNEVADEFLKTVKKEGYGTMLYGSKNYLNSVWKYNDNDVWLAHYTKETDYDKEYVMWQLCQNGKIDGIDTMVDINVLYN